MRKSLRLTISFVVLVAAVLFLSPSPATAAGTLHGPYQVQGIQSDKCIDIPHGSASNNVVLNIWTCKNPVTGNQKFWAEDHGGGNWEIWNPQNGKCLTVKGASTKNNAPIIQYDCTLGANEVWSFTDDYEVVNKKSKKCLTVKGRGTANGTTLLQYTCNGGDNQVWTWATQW